MEQLVARRAHNPKVAGSSPAPATTPKPTSRRLCSFKAQGLVVQRIGCGFPEPKMQVRFLPRPLFFRKSKRANPSGLALDFLVEHAQCPLGRAGRVFIVLQSGGIRACLPDPG